MKYEIVSRENGGVTEDAVVQKETSGGSFSKRIYSSESVE